MAPKGKPTSWTVDALAFTNAIDKREAAGVPIFGDYNPATDKRSMAQETIEEVEDGATYQRFERVKYQGNKKICGLSHDITRHLFMAWILLREQAELEKGSKS